MQSAQSVKRSLNASKYGQNTVFANILQNKITTSFFIDPIKAWLSVIATLIGVQGKRIKLNPGLRDISTSL